MVKCRIEARDLRQFGVKFRERIDGGKVVGLMERGQRNEARIPAITEASIRTGAV